MHGQHSGIVSMMPMYWRSHAGSHHTGVTRTHHGHTSTAALVIAVRTVPCLWSKQHSHHVGSASSHWQAVPWSHWPKTSHIGIKQLICRYAAGFGPFHFLVGFWVFRLFGLFSTFGTTSASGGFLGMLVFRSAQVRAFSANRQHATKNSVPAA